VVERAGEELPAKATLLALRLSLVSNTPSITYYPLVPSYTGQAHLAIERVFRYSDQVTLPSEAPGMERRPPYGYARALVVS